MKKWKLTENEKEIWKTFKHTKPVVLICDNKICLNCKMADLPKKIDEVTC